MSSAPSTPEEWAEYFEAVLAKPLHPHFEKLDKYLPTGGRALELGCGVGKGVLHLLERGFHVTAVDRDERALEVLRRLLPKDAPVDVVHSGFLDLNLDSYDVVVAQFSLWFLKPEEFAPFWPRLAASVKPGGLFSGQFLGVHDSWNDQGQTLLDRRQVESLLEDFEVLSLEEIDRPGKDVFDRPKHWHIFHVVARKGG